MNLQDLIGKRECILNPRLVFRIQLCSRIQMCTLWSQFSKIFTYKRILRGHTPKCQHLFYLTAFILFNSIILFSDIITTATCQAQGSSPSTVVNKKDPGLSLMKHVNQWLYLGKAELQCDFLFFLISFLKLLHLTLL